MNFFIKNNFYLLQYLYDDIVINRFIENCNEPINISLFYISTNFTIKNKSIRQYEEYHKIYKKWYRDRSKINNDKNKKYKRRKIIIDTR